MPTTKAQQKAVHKYVKANYDRIEITVPKGQKQAIQAHAEKKGESPTAWSIASCGPIWGWRSGPQRRNPPTNKNERLTA